MALVNLLSPYESLPQGPKHRNHGRGQSAPSPPDEHLSRPRRTDCGHYKHSWAGGWQGQRSQQWHLGNECPSWWKKGGWWERDWDYFFFNKLPFLCRKSGQHTLKLERIWSWSRVKTASPVSPCLSDGCTVRAKRVRPWQRAAKVQVGGLEDVHHSISAATEDGVFRQTQRVGRTGLKAAHEHCLTVSGWFHPITEAWIQQYGQQSVLLAHQQVLHSRLPKTSCTWPLPSG